MTEDNDVFTIMTSNDVSQLPPELIRPGRIDAQWYFGLPTQNERESILNIHLKKFKRTIDDSVVKNIAKESNNYTGAELELIVKTAVRKSYKRFCQDESSGTDITEEDLLSSIQDVVPVFKYNRQQVMMLEQYARDRTRKTSSPEVDDIAQIDDDFVSEIISAQGTR